MKFDRKSLLLYAVTDRAWVGRQTLCGQVESALKGGATCIQLREKEIQEPVLEKLQRTLCQNTFPLTHDRSKFALGVPKRRRPCRQEESD